MLSPDVNNSSFVLYSPYSVIERMPGSPTWAPEFYEPLWDTALAHLLEFFSFISHINPYHVPFPSAIDSLLPVSLATFSVLDTNTNNRSLTPFPYKCSSSVRECDQRSHPDVRYALGSFILPFHILTKNSKFSDSLSSLDALITALTDLDNVCESVEDEYLKSLREGDFERWEERT